MELEKPNFPVTSVCPLCRQSNLYLFDDIVANCVWLNCADCKAHGDIITFGSQIWNTSLPDTIKKFSDLAVISASEGERAAPEYVRFQAKLTTAEQFWTEVETQVWNHGDDVIACRLREFGLRHEIDACAGLVGVAHPDQVSRLCAALGRPKPPRSREDGAAIVYPFYDLPGRVTGLLIAQYTENFEARHNFIPVNCFKKRRPEAGYFMLDKLLAAPPEQFKGHQFISDDVQWALKTQITRARKNAPFFPLVASYSGLEAESYGTSWQAFNSAPRIFHGTTMSASLVSRACNARGYVSAAVLRQPTPEANLISMRTNTKTWQEAAKIAILNADEINAKSFAEKLTIPQDKLSVFLLKLDHPFSAGFADRVLAAVDIPPADPHRKWMIIEKENGWWNHIGRPIANVCPRITRVVQTDDGDKMYAGTITHADGEVYSFSDSAKKIEDIGLLAYSDAVLAPHKKLVIYDKLWNARSHQFALQMHPPEIINISTRYGWDAHNQVFRFDKYEIAAGGEVRHTPPWPKTGAISFDDPLPIAPLPIRDFLSPAHENSYVWNIVAAVLGNLIAPILNLEPAATAVTGHNFFVVTETAKALCCPVERAVAAHKHGARGFYARFNKELVWPTLVYNTFADEILGNIVPRHFNAPLIVRLAGPAAAVAPGYGWQTLLPNDARPVGDIQILRHVVPAYVQHVLTQRYTEFNKQEHLHRQMLRSLHNWLLETYNAAFNLSHAEKNVYEPADAHVAMMRGLKKAFSSGQIHLLPQPRRKDQARNYVVQKLDSWWLNRHAVDRYFMLERSVAPNWLAVLDLLQKDGIYIGEKTIHNMTGFLLRRDWCQQFWSDDNLQQEKETG